MNSQEQVYYAGVQCVVRRDGLILLGCRSQTSAEGFWALPGGHIRFAESPLDAARRELKEETMLDGVNARILSGFVTYTTQTPYVHFPVIFTEVHGEAMLPPQEKFSELRYFSIDELPEPLLGPSKTVIRALQEEKIAGETAATGIRHFRLDLLCIRPAENRNRGYCIVYFADGTAIRLVLSWGRRGAPSWREKIERFRSDREALKRVEEVVALRVRHEYLLAGAIGDISLLWLAQLFPADAEIRVEAGALIRRVASNAAFRAAYLRDQVKQGGLFEEIADSKHPSAAK